MRDYPTELLTNSQMSEADALTLDTGMSGLALMERAGAAVADAARQILVAKGGRNVVIVCGPGNNGGDGFVAAQLLKNMGYSVEAGLLGTKAILKGDAAQAAARWTGRIGSAALVNLDEADLVIDALFGAGLARDIDGRALAIIERINQWRIDTGKPVLAVDMPSGVDGDTGAVRGVAIKADASVTFFRLKPGHVVLPGRDLCGRLVLEDIGIMPKVLQVIAPATRVNAPESWLPLLPVPQINGHKYLRGHALVLSGPAHQTGAARLAAGAALRAGAGLVSVAAQKDAIAANAAHLTAVMIAPFEGEGGFRALLDDRRKNAVAIGPGAVVGTFTASLAAMALEHPNAPAMVLDADAITSFEASPEALFSLIKARTAPVVLTPHEGEFVRLFGAAPGASGPRIQLARMAAIRSGATICLKGPDTIVAAPDGRCSVMGEATPWLATAGSGDVLTGIVTGLLAQRMPAFEAASAGVWMHACAARLFGPGLVADDLAAMMPAVWQKLKAG
ncbi:MAG: NAD(P)H-hydrate dehydratase [Beijerinckiaceae bacterium]|jgi:ADP-dependent NAD(P)H-hydrate dehydratase / NAD(P)H-hydrate epimerase|nr:NAD(P)H-hydrate dehydratase [Beijerinckiaceae bacterium]